MKDRLITVFCTLVIIVLVGLPILFFVGCVGDVLYVKLVEEPRKEREEQEGLAKLKEANRIAAEEEARIAKEKQDYYYDKYEGKIFNEIFGEHKKIATDYEYLGIIYDVYESGALFVRKSDEQFSIPEVMEYNGREFPVIGMIGKQKSMGSYLESPHCFYLWNEETFPANWKYLFNVCFADGLTKVVIPETVEYYEICELPYNYHALGGVTSYVNNTLEEIVIESKFDPREWCFCSTLDNHCYVISSRGGSDIYDETYACLPERFTTLNGMYRHYPALKQVTIMPWITSIPYGVTFHWYPGFPTFGSLQISRIEVPSTVRNVHLGAFDYVPMTEFDFYSGVKYDGAITGWKVKELNLTADYSFSGTVTVVDCSELETLYISVTTRDTEYPGYVIRNCPNLKTVYIDSGDLLCSVSISDCKNLESVTIVNLPPNGNDAMFSNVNTGFILKVPSKYVDYYSVVYKDLNVVSCE